MNPVIFELENEKYQLIPHTGFEAINLYRKVNGAVGNMVNALPKGGRGRGFQLCGHCRRIRGLRR